MKGTIEELSPKVFKAIFDLNNDKDFDKIFKDDEELDELEKSSIDKDEEMLSLQLMVTGKNTIAGYDVNRINTMGTMHPLADGQQSHR